jgi:hypothetical protein
MSQSCVGFGMPQNTLSHLLFLRYSHTKNDVKCKKNLPNKNQGMKPVELLVSDIFPSVALLTVIFDRAGRIDVMVNNAGISGESNEALVENNILLWLSFF